ncbi:Glycerate dehydrogenase [Vibrio nigripulchritudo MADA3029]|uniref:D-2-hydroxyacid dehydrogenase n=1 Tax=Vibrio nigripulchritudo TaxID=28173 RepID=UPI0003B233B2|nr:D-2-hydroxyacid dehydrogenase [Vibrio nigripulchritudo]CCN45099.1 Glycerate dehydrogenase [Vibrio nigripulchritudo MADA3020]CCN54437.1 Glycerate dehydrogenase [Vibrio nigripulchritudo MADA3021]CCN57487.1 Glycerate dehydrogenase [Vibrio nigripulchritudo MADA3029]
MKIVFLDRDTIPAQIPVPKPVFDHEWIEYSLTTVEETASRIQDADIIITNKVVLNSDNLQAAASVKLIAVAATGTNNIDLEYCRSRGIAVCNIQGYATQSVPEHVIASVFALRRNLMAYHQDIANGEWQKKKQFCFFTHPIGDIAGSTMGIIGSGALGRATGELGKSVGMNVIYAERKGESECRQGYSPFEQVLTESDVISLHCPLTESTLNLIGAYELKQMKNNAILINAGRGGLVDENALVEALQSNTIAGASVDVFTQEPADESNPLIANMDLPNLLLTPHVAWGSDSAITRLCEILVENIESFALGKLKNKVV